MRAYAHGPPLPPPTRLCLYRALQEAELSRSHFSELADGVKVEVDLANRTKHGLGEQRLAMEHKIAARLVDAQRRAERADAAAKQAAATKAKQRTAAADASKQQIAHLVQKTAASAAAERKVREATQAAEQERQLNSILSLKTNRDRAADKDSTRLRTRQRREAREAVENKRERAELLEQGLNPAAVMLARKREAASTDRRQAQADRTRAHEQDVVEKLLREEARFEKQAKLDAKRGASPSKRKAKKPASAAATATVEPYPEVDASAPDAVEEDEAATAAAAASSAYPDEDAATPEFDFGALDGPGFDDDMTTDVGDEAFAEPEFEGLWDDTPSPSAGRSANLPTKADVERRMLAQALGRAQSARQKPQTQTIAGRTFSGVPFKSEPATVMFKDFEVGITYRQKVTLTNVSLSLNNFKMLPPPSETIEYERIPTKALSSGMSTEMVVTYTPRANEDFTGEMSLLSQTGVFTIPVVCRTKKCAMSVSEDAVDFGHIYLGEKRTKKVVLKNAGSLGTSWDLAWDEPSPAVTAAPAPAPAPAAASTDSVPTKPKLGPEDGADESVDEELPAAASIEPPGIDLAADATVSPPINATDADATGGAEAILVGEDFAAEEDAHLVADESAADEEVKSSAVPFVVVGGTTSGELGPSSSVTITIEYYPDAPAVASSSFTIRYGVPGVPDTVLSVSAACVAVPVQLDEDTLMFGMCKCGLNYSTSVIVRNRQDAAAKVAFKVPDEFGPFVTIVPGAGMIPGHGLLKAEVQFHPGLAMLGELEDAATLDMRFPVTVDVQDQVLPVVLNVQAAVTAASMALSCSAIDFGRVNVYESAVAVVQITNTSPMAQKFGFVGVPEYVSVQPGDGFGELLPGESIDLDVVFSPPQKLGDYADINFEFDLTCRWSGNSGKRRIHCAGVGVVPPLRLSSSRIRFGATSVGTEARGTVMLRNYTKKPTHYEFVLPAGAEGIDIHPRTGTLDGGARQRIFVYHVPADPKPDVGPADEGLEGSASSPADAEAGPATESTGSGAAAPAVAPIVELLDPDMPADEVNVRRVPVKCVMQQGNAPGAAGHDDPVSMVGLDLFLANTPPVLAVDTASSDLAFSEVSIGKSTIGTVSIKNTSSSPQPLSARVLDPLGPFQMANALRQLAPGAAHTVRVLFRPQTVGSYFDFLEVLCGPTMLRLKMSGVCADASVELGCDETDGVLELGDCLVGARITKELTVTNTSAFPINFGVCVSSDAARETGTPAAWDCLDPRQREDLSTFERAARAGPALATCHPLSGAPAPVPAELGGLNVNGTPTFSFEPPHGSIGVGASTTLSVTFSPDREGTDFSDKALLHFSKAAPPRTIVLRGRGRRPVYVTGHDSTTNDQAQNALATAFASNADAASTKRITLSFESPVGGGPEAPCCKRTLVIGAAGGDGIDKKAGKGEFSFETPTDSTFNIDTMKGAVDVGATKTVTITFKPGDALGTGTSSRATAVLTTTFGTETTTYQVSLCAVAAS